MPATSLFAAPDIPSELKKFGVQDAAIAEMSRQYMPLTIKGIDDKAGAESVHKAKMIVVKARTSTEKVRKDLKADALAYGRAVDSEANRIFALLEPIENHLKCEELKIEKELEAIRNADRLRQEAEERAKREAEEAERKRQIEAENARVASERAELAKQREAMEAERKRQEEESRARQEAEHAELRRLRELLEAERRKQEEAHAVELARLRAEQEKIDAANRAAEAERMRLAGIEAARLRKIEDDRVAAERAEQQRTQAEQAKQLAEKLRPDKEKLLAVAAAVAGIVVPDVESIELIYARKEINVVLDDAEDKIRSIVAMAAATASP